MNSPQQRLELKRKKFHSSLPQVKITTCRIERSKSSELQRFIIEGDPVLLGVVLPRIEIGGLVPIKIRTSVDGRIAVGMVKGIPESSGVLIDYGFTKDSCPIEETAFGQKDARIFKRISRLPVRRARRNKFWRKIRRFLAGIFLKRDN